VLAAPIGIAGHEHARNDLSGQLAVAALAWWRAGRATEQATGVADQEQRGVTVDGEAVQNRGAGGLCGVDARGDGERCNSRYAMRDGGMSLYIFFSEGTKIRQQAYWAGAQA
jgi:hypothetical protein